MMKQRFWKRELVQFVNLYHPTPSIIQPIRKAIPLKKLIHACDILLCGYEDLGTYFVLLLRNN